MDRRRRSSSLPSQVACSPVMEAMANMQLHIASMVEKTRELIEFLGFF
jgi:hypothetical protein